MEKLTFLQLRGIFSQLPVIRSGAELLQGTSLVESHPVREVFCLKYFNGEANLSMASGCLQRIADHSPLLRKVLLAPTKERQARF